MFKKVISPFFDPTTKQDFDQTSDIEIFIVQNEVILFQRIALVSAALTIVFTPIYFLSGFPEIAWIPLPGTAIFLMCAWKARKFPLWTRSTYLFTAQALVFFFSNIYSLSSCLFLFFIPIIFFPLIFFSHKEKFLIICFCILGLLLLLWMVTDPGGFFIKGTFSNILLKTAQSFSVLGTLVMLGLFVNIYRKMNQAFVRSLSEYAKIATLGRFAASVVHEVSNPLTVAMNLSSCIYRELDGPNADIDSLKKLCKKVQSSTTYMANVIDGLKKLSLSAQALKFERFPLREAIEEAIQLSESKALKSQVTLALNGDSQITLSAARTQIIQVLVNLIKNAIEACAESSERWVAISYYEIASQVTIQIRDSGPGIDPKIREHIFEPFHSTKSAQGGTGLGLAICTQIIAAHSGDLFVESFSSPTCIQINLPRKGD